MLSFHKQTIAIFVLKDCTLANSIIILIFYHMLMEDTFNLAWKNTDSQDKIQCWSICFLAP